MTHKILVTGGAGFVGSNLVRILLENGHQVSVLDSLVRGRRAYLDGLDVEIVEADIRDLEQISPVIARAERVVHLAALGSVVESVEDPVTNFEFNVRGTFNVLLAAARGDVDKLVFSSTGGALIGNVAPPVSEKSLPRPISPYGAGKLCCEAYCFAFGQSYGLDTVCTRFANVYGPFSDHKGGVINQFFRCVKAGDPLIVYGDGSSSRDYIHVADLCRGIYAALTSDRASNDIFHLASGKETSLDELARHFRGLSGDPEYPIVYRDKRTGEVDRNFASYHHARELLGFEPSVALEDGLRQTWEWLERRQFD